MKLWTNLIIERTEDIPHLTFKARELRKKKLLKIGRRFNAIVNADYVYINKRKAKDHCKVLQDFYKDNPNIMVVLTRTTI